MIIDRLCDYLINRPLGAAIGFVGGFCAGALEGIRQGSEAHSGGFTFIYISTDGDDAPWINMFVLFALFGGVIIGGVCGAVCGAAIGIWEGVSKGISGPLGYFSEETRKSVNDFTASLADMARSFENIIASPFFAIGRLFSPTSLVSSPSIKVDSGIANSELPPKETENKSTQDINVASKDVPPPSMLNASRQSSVNVGVGFAANDAANTPSVGNSHQKNMRSLISR